MKFLYFWIFLGLSMWLPSTLSACECESPTDINQQIENADLIFEGKVSFVKTNWMSGGWKFSFEVSQTWKKAAAKHLIINTKWKRDCGFVFEEGKTYLVYANKTFGLKTAQCMGNKEIGEAEKDLAALGESLEPMNEPEGSAMGLTLIFLTLGSMVLLAFVVLRKKGDDK